MNELNNRKNAHNDIDHIFKNLLPAQGMKERAEQVALCHRMLDTMMDGQIALCDAGTGIGKTYAYLVAGTVFHRCRAASGLAQQPIVISTSSIALQRAVVNEYLPLLSAVLMADGKLEEPLRAVIRKGKAHYVCDLRLMNRLRRVDLTKKNPQAAQALLSLKNHLDIDETAHLSGSVSLRSATVKRTGADTAALWKCVPPTIIPSRSATTIFCWPTPSTGAPGRSPFCRNTALW